MRVVLIISALLLVAASGAILVPDAEPIRPCLSETALALAIFCFDRGVLAVAPNSAAAKTRGRAGPPIATPT